MASPDPRAQKRIEELVGSLGVEGAIRKLAQEVYELQRRTGADLDMHDALHTRSHEPGGGDEPIVLNALARVGVRISGVDVGIRRFINFLTSGDVFGVAGADDEPNEEVDLSISGPSYALAADIEDVDDVEDAGSASSLARGDHVHAHGSGYSPNAHHTEIHNLLSTPHGDTAPATAVRGDIITAQAASPLWKRLAASIPAANVLTLLGFANGDTEPGYKTVLDGTTPASVAAAGSAGTSLVFAHRDHVHPHGTGYSPDAHHTHPYARVLHNAAQAIVTATFTILAFNTERWDTDVIHDNSTNNSRLTCKTAGLYEITAHVGWNSNAVGQRDVQIYLNGSAVLAWIIQDPASSGECIQVVTTQYLLAVNDYVEVRVKQTSGGNLDVFSSSASSPEFMMARIG